MRGKVHDRYEAPVVRLEYGLLQFFMNSAFPKSNRPWLHIDLDEATATVQMITEWIEVNGIQVLNVAGPRASKDPGIHDFVVDIFERVWEE